MNADQKRNASAIGIILGFGAVFLFITAIESFNNEPSLSFEQKIVEVSKELNKTLPRTLDQVTRMDTTIPGPGKKITYLYTLLGLSSKDLTMEVKSEIEKSVRSQVKKSSGTKVFRENNVDMKYVYRDEKGVEIFSFTIDH